MSADATTTKLCRCGGVNCSTAHPFCQACWRRLDSGLRARILAADDSSAWKLIDQARTMLAMEGMARTADERRRRRIEREFERQDKTRAITRLALLFLTLLALAALLALAFVPAAGPAVQPPEEAPQSRAAEEVRAAAVTVPDSPFPHSSPWGNARVETWRTEFTDANERTFHGPVHRAPPPSGEPGEFPSLTEH